MAERRLPGPIFNYIDGAADDETTHRRNIASFERCDLFVDGPLLDQVRLGALLGSMLSAVLGVSLLISRPVRRANIT